MKKQGEVKRMNNTEKARILSDAAQIMEDLSCKEYGEALALFSKKGAHDKEGIQKLGMSLYYQRMAVDLFGDAAKLETHE